MVNENNIRPTPVEQEHMKAHRRFVALVVSRATGQPVPTTYQGTINEAFYHPRPDTFRMKAK